MGVTGVNGLIKHGRNVSSTHVLDEHSKVCVHFNIDMLSISR